MQSYIVRVQSDELVKVWAADKAAALAGEWDDYKSVELVSTTITDPDSTRPPYMSEAEYEEHNKAHAQHEPDDGGARTIDELRAAGHLVLTFTPDELAGVEDYGVVEDALVQQSWDVIESARTTTIPADHDSQEA